MLFKPGYQKIFPRRYWPMSAAVGHRFEVVDPWWSPYEIVQLQAGGLARIQPSAFCLLLEAGSYIGVLVPISGRETVSEALLQLGKLLFTGGRTEKYLTLFKVYETVCRQPGIRFAALRHALAHATAVLNRPKTVAALNASFGTVHVDLSLHRHQTIFWRILGELLLEVDRLLALELRALGKSIHMPLDYKQPLTNSVARHYFPREFSALLSNPLHNPDARGETARAG